jgi:hypothetical protein
MAGLLIASTGSGQVISRTGHYRFFPPVGMALVTLGMFLLGQLGAGTSAFVSSSYQFVLGFGLGLVMQVLVLAAQNAVDYRLLGVATSGSALARQIGGSIGVSVFGAIFTNRLASELADRLPPGVHTPAHGGLAAVRHLPRLIHEAYVAAYSAALHPVFLVAAAVMLCAFGLSWLLRDVPLRDDVESVADPLLTRERGDGSSVPRGAEGGARAVAASARRPASRRGGDRRRASRARGRAGRSG